MSTTPICRCRVLYLGSAVPHISKDGLQGIQEPLRELYPDQGPLTAKGIDSWLSVWSNGLLLENVDESRRQITRFFPIESLHYCAAVRYVVVPGTGSEKIDKFLPLDSPFAKHANGSQPPLFACILRRTTGIRVLECHAFICKKETAANALVRCCFHAYADSMYARQLEENPYYMETKRAQSAVAGANGGSSVAVYNTVEKVEAWRNQNDRELPERPTTNGASPSESGQSGKDDENYKVWMGAAPTEREMIYMDTAGTVRSVRSGAGSTVDPSQASRQSRPRQMILPSGPPPPPPPPTTGSLSVMSSSKMDGRGKGHMKKGKHSKKELIPVSNGYHHGPPMHPPPHHHHSGVPPPPSIYAATGYYTERVGKGRFDRPVLSTMEEPLYMPSARPLSPVASYHPGAFPYEQYYLQQYGGTNLRSEKGHKKKKEKGDKGNGNGSEMDSPFNTGIYRKKGHLNERAFSYSIRQEHRSRSTSLANLHFMSNGDAQPSHEDENKKDRELAQMVGDLELNGHGHSVPSSENNFIRKKAPNYHR